MNIKPLHSNVLIKPLEPEAISKGGIIIPESFQERPNVAVIVAVGTGIENRPMELQEGDIVFHIKNAGTLIEQDGEKYFFIRDVDVHGYIREAKEE